MPAAIEEGNKTKQKNVSMTPQTEAVLAEIGNGKVSTGLRELATLFAVIDQYLNEKGKAEIRKILESIK